jgi:methionyl-tRNA synthetase
MLLAAQVAAAKRVWAHGYVQWEGAKMSKTAGTAVSLETAIERHGPDALRYYLLRATIGFWNDGDFTERFDARYIADLADGLGKPRLALAVDESRATKTVSFLGPATALDPRGGGSPRCLPRLHTTRISISPRRCRRLGAGERGQPVHRAEGARALAKADRNVELDEVLAALARCLYRCTVLMEPFTPGKAGQLWSALGQAGEVNASSYAALGNPSVEGLRTSTPPILFPKPTS